MSLFNLGDFRLHSGAVSRFKIDCDALTDADLEALAVMLVERLPPFGAVLGVPRGGKRIAAALRRYVMPGHPTLLVDDVLTTGDSLVTFRAALGVPCFGAVLFARGPCPEWVSPLFTLAPARGGQIK